MKKYCPAFILVLMFCSFGYGQTPYFKNYFLLKKNEPVQVNTIFQDKTGYMWYGTNKGLFKYDGIKQKRFTAADGLQNENVTAVSQDTAGRIWIGYKTGALAFIEKDTIKKFNPPEGSAINEVSDILFDKQGNLWFSTLGDGLYYYSGSRLFRIDEKEKMPDLFIYDIAEDQQGNIWCGTDGGAVKCTFHENAFTTKVIDYEKGLPDNIVKKIAIDPDGTVWMATEEAGIIAYDCVTEKCKPLIAGKWELGSVSDFLFSGKEVWISCLQKGLAVYNQSTGLMRTYDAKVQPGFSNINTLLSDAEGSIWVGTASGIVRTPGSLIEYIDVTEPANDPNVIALAVGKEGSIWFSTKEGLFKRTMSTSGSGQIEKQLVHTAYEKNTVISLFIDADNYVWAGFFGVGVVRINPVTGKVRYLDKELYDGNILNITGKDHTIWLATLGGATQIKTSGEQLSIQHFTRKEGLNSDYIYQVFIDSKDRVWFATDGKGVDMLDESGFHHYPDGLNSKVVYGFAEDGEHHIWANVQGDGIYQFNGAKFIALNSGIKLHDNNVTCLASGKNGNLATMHDLGIDVYDATKNKNHFFGEAFGIHDKKANLNAVAKDSQGRIYFGTDNGILVFSGMDKNEMSMPRPYIEGIKIMGQNAALTRDMSLSYDQNDITLNLLGFWYQNPENLSFQYKLENYDRGWTTSHNYLVNYSSLPPGEYTFRLKASDSETFSEANESSFSFVIHPPFWRTVWFYVLSISITILLIYLFIKYREKKLQRDNKILEEKNAELKKINMELDKFVYSVSHDLRAPLLSMLGVVEISESEAENEFIKDNLGFLKGSIHKLDGFIKDILEYSRNSRTAVQKQEIDFREMLTDITKNLKYMGANARPVDVKVEIKNQKTFVSDKSRISILLNNLISNAIRYQNPAVEKPFVGLEIDMSDTETNIIVKDNGIGIDQANQKKIFEMFYRVSENSVGSGLGLYLVKEIVEKLHGDIKVESEIGIGTSFSISIPNN